MNRSLDDKEKMERIRQLEFADDLDQLIEAPNRVFKTNPSLQTIQPWNQELEVGKINAQRMSSDLYKSSRAS